MASPDISEHVLDENFEADEQMPITEDEINALLGDEPAAVFDTTVPSSSTRHDPVDTGEGSSSSIQQSRDLEQEGDSSNKTVAAENIPRNSNQKAELEEEIMVIGEEEGISAGSSRNTLQRETSKGKRLSALADVSVSPRPANDNSVTTDPDSSEVPKKRAKVTGTYFLVRNTAREAVAQAIGNGIFSNLPSQAADALKCVFQALEAEDKRRNARMIEIENALRDLKDNFDTKMKLETQKTHILTEQLRTAHQKLREAANVMRSCSQKPTPLPPIELMAESGFAEVNQTIHQNIPRIATNNNKNSHHIPMGIPERRIIEVIEQVARRPALVPPPLPNHSMQHRPQQVAPPQPHPQQRMSLHLQPSVQHYKSPQRQPRPRAQPAPQPLTPREILLRADGMSQFLQKEPEQRNPLIPNGRNYGHWEKSEMLVNRPVEVLDRSSGSREILCHIPRIMFGNLRRENMASKINYPRHIANSDWVTRHAADSPKMSIELRTTKSEFNDNWQFAGVIKYEGLQRLEKKGPDGRKDYCSTQVGCKLQLAVLIWSMSPYGITGKIMHSEKETDWGTTIPQACNFSGKTKFRIKMHANQELLPNDMISIFGIIYDESTRLYDATSIVEMQYV